MSEYVESASCGPYELVAQKTNSLLERDDGTVQVQAESRYLVRLGSDAERDVLSGALVVPRGGSEGTLRFGNFIGIAELGGRRLDVTSDRLSSGAVRDMLDEVAARLASLPFTVATPTAAPYVRGRELTPDVLYHAFAFLRDAMSARGPHDLPGAIERILAHPYESLRADETRLVALAEVTRIDARTLSSIQSAPELLAPLAPDSPLGLTPLAQRLRGRMPGMVRVVPLAHDEDTVENRFVVAALDVMTDVARRFERFSRTSRHATSAVNAHEAADMADRLQRWRRHHTFDRLEPARALPIQSTVLRQRAGYRELLATYLELLARTRLAEPHDVQPLLELRDAALVYEYWCYFTLVAIVERILDRAPTLSRFSVTALDARVPYGYHARWKDLELVYNTTFSPRSTTGECERGRDSYSVRLRPDVTMRTPAGRMHVFDAKLKLQFGSALAADDADDAEERPDTFKREDLYKMHAYRDALGADSVWILYPGSDPVPQRYAVPWIDPGGLGFQGVGAVSLRPGDGSDGGLTELVETLLGK